MNIAKMLKEAQRMQERMADAQADLSNRIVESTSGGGKVKVTATGAGDITWGRDIAITQFYPPHMYLFLFLISLPGQFLFGVTTMTMAATVTLATAMAGKNGRQVVVAAPPPRHVFCM